MPANKRNGRSKLHRIGYIAVGFNKKDNFWYSSEGIFNSPKAALKDLNEYYSVNFSYSVKIQLKKPKK